MSPAGAGVWNLIHVSAVCRSVTRRKLIYGESRCYQHQSYQRHNISWKVNQKQDASSSLLLHGYTRQLSTTKSNSTTNHPKPLKYVPPEASTKNEKSESLDEDVKSKLSDGIRPDMTFREVWAESHKKTTALFTGGLGVRGLIKKYGLPFTIYYSALYFGGMGCCYLALESGLVGETGILDMVRMTPIADYIDLSRIDPKHGNIAGAIVANEILELVRLPFAILTVPYIKAAWDKRKSSADADKP